MEPSVERLVAGPFARADLDTRFDPAPRPSNPALDAWIELRWPQLCAAAQRDGRELFDGALLRFVGARVHHGAAAAAPSRRRLDLLLGPGRYRDFAATNLDPEMLPADRGGVHPWSCFGNALGSSALVATADGQLVLGRRSDRVFGYPGWLHAFGGMLEASDGSADRIDPFRAIERELREELGIEVAELRTLTLHAIVREPRLHQPELLFHAEIALSFAELEARWRRAESRAEHAALVALPSSPGAALAALAALPRVSPIARACLDEALAR